LYELAGPQQASGAQAPQGPFVAPDEAPAGPSAAELDFGAWNEMAQANLDMDLGFNWLEDEALLTAHDGWT
jgi:hypothetical protein